MMETHFCINCSGTWYIFVSWSWPACDRSVLKDFLRIYSIATFFCDWTNVQYCLFDTVEACVLWPGGGRSSNVTAYVRPDEHSPMIVEDVRRSFRKNKHSSIYERVIFDAFARSSAMDGFAPDPCEGSRLARVVNCNRFCSRSAGFRFSRDRVRRFPL